MEVNLNKNVLHFLNSLSFLLIVLGIFFIPFNSYEGLPFLGEFSKESSIIFFITAVVFFLIGILKSKKIKIPLRHPIFLVHLLLIIWFLLSFLFNIIDIGNYFFKGISGAERFLRQYLAFLISGGILLIMYYNIFSNIRIQKLFYTIRKVFLISFIIISIYTTIEVLIIYFGQTSLIPLLYIFDYFPFCEAYLDFKFGRVSSVTFEPPAFASYLMTISGWMFSYIITSRGIKSFVPLILVVVFAFLSGSRSGLVIILIQLLVFLMYFIKQKKYHKRLIFFLLILTLFSSPIIVLKGHSLGIYVKEKLTSFSLDNSDHSNSNQSRFGMIYTSFLVFLENPVIGVGFGQVAFEAKELYPHWATKRNWEFRDRYLNENYKPFPPSYNLYTRLLAETGIIGFILFSILIIFIIYSSYKMIKPKNKNAWMFLILLVSFTGYSFNWLQIDTFRIFGFWICFALLLLITKNKIHFKKI